MQYLIALAVDLLFGMSHLSVARMIVVCWSSKRCQIGFSPLCGCSGVIAGQSGTSQGRRNKNGVVRACLLYSSAPTFPDGEIQC